MLYYSFKELGFSSLRGFKPYLFWDESVLIMAEAWSLTFFYECCWFLVDYLLGRISSVIYLWLAYSLTAGPYSELECVIYKVLEAWFLGSGLTAVWGYPPLWVNLGALAFKISNSLSFWMFPCLFSLRIYFYAWERVWALVLEPTWTATLFQFLP